MKRSQEFNQACSIIEELVREQATIRRVGGEWAPTFSELWKCVLERLPHAENFTFHTVRKVLIFLHLHRRVYLNKWDGNRHLPWRGDWTGFFGGGFRLLDKKP